MKNKSNKNLPPTEQDSHYNDLEKMDVNELLTGINKEDNRVTEVIRGVLPAIGKLITAIEPDFRGSGRLFYIGSGTSGRLGILDASECPPTFGVDHGKVIGIIAGGDAAIRKAQEFAEDDIHQGWKDLKAFDARPGDWVIGLSASGSTPYVAGALGACNEAGISTGSITCNSGSPIEKLAKYPVVAETGPEFVTGSTRMKAGTAQKMILNMISTALFIKSGRVKGNKMVDMQLTNHKLIKRGVGILQVMYNWDAKKAEKELIDAGSVRKVMEKYD